MVTAARISGWLARELAVKAGVDPRTIIREAQGDRVRGMAGERARRALADAGLPSSDSHKAKGVAT